MTTGARAYGPGAVKVGIIVPIDGLLFTALAAELQHALTNARIQSVHQPRSSDILLQLRKPGETRSLLISTHPEGARIHLTERTFQNPVAPPAFCLLLRKHLIPGRIVAVHQPAFERVANIVIEGFGADGGRALKVLCAEIMGRHSNLVLIDQGDGLVIDALKRIPADANAYRAIVPGRPYVPPPPQDKLDPRTASYGAFETAIRHMGADTQVDRALQRAVMGIGPFSAREISARSKCPPQAVRADLTEDDIKSLWRSLRALVDRIDQGEVEPTHIESDGRAEFWCFRSEALSGVQTPHDSVQQLLDRHFALHEEHETSRALAAAIRAALRHHRARIEKKMDLQRTSVDEAGRADAFRKAGDLLTANLYRLRSLPPGQTSVTLEDFDEASTPVAVTLDPRLSIGENAQAYYRRYQKAKKTLEKASEQLQASQAELDYLDSVETALDLAVGAADLEEIHDELEKQGYVNRRSTSRGMKKRGIEVKEPFGWLSSDGFPIAVGRNNRQNDRLTLHTARPDDLWLHAKEIPGAHVIVSTRGAEPPIRTLHEAAILAALHSKAKHSSNVPVDYTLCRHVRKPRGAKPGMVIYDNHKTVYVTPDEAIQARLKTESERVRR